MKKYYLAFIIINILLLFFSLFISNFNWLKTSLLIILGFNILYLGLFFFIKKEEFIAKSQPFYLEWEKFLNLIDTPLVIYDEEMKINFVNEAFLKLVNVDKNFFNNLKIETWLVKNKQYLKLALIFFPSLVADKLEIVKNNTINDEVDIIRVSYQEEIFLYIITTKLTYQKQSFNLKIVIDQSSEIKQHRQSLEFLNLMAHHLRTPLTQLKWLLESARNAENQEIFNQALSIIDKTIFLTQMVILSSKTELGNVQLNIELNNIEDLIKNCLEFFKYYLEEKNIKVEIYINETVKNFYFDKNIMFFILYPLIENAIDYNKSNGQIIINIDKEQKVNEVVIKISDTGIGIDNEEIINIFKKYFRGKEAKEIKPTGFGLGLSLAYNLTKIHKGEIKVSSQKNQGTTFILNFPLNKEAYEI